MFIPTTTFVIVASAVIFAVGLALLLRQKAANDRDRHDYVSNSNRASIQTGRPTIPGVVVLVLIIVALALTNPQKADFAEFLQNQVMAETSVPSDVFEAIGSAMADFTVGAMVSQFTIRSDYVLFSIYHIRVEGDDLLWLGILRQFFQVGARLR